MAKNGSNTHIIGPFRSDLECMGTTSRAALRTRTPRVRPMRDTAEASRVHGNLAARGGLRHRAKCETGLANGSRSVQGCIGRSGVEVGP